METTQHTAYVGASHNTTERLKRLANMHGETDRLAIEGRRTSEGTERQGHRTSLRSWHGVDEQQEHRIEGRSGIGSGTESAKDTIGDVFK